LAAETCSDNKKNQDETGIDCGGVCRSCAVVAADINAQNEEFSAPSGFAVKNLATQKLNVFIAAIILVSIALSLFAWKRFRRMP
jgi:hypothetical protein